MNSKVEFSFFRSNIIEISVTKADTQHIETTSMNNENPMERNGGEPNEKMLMSGYSPYSTVTNPTQPEIVTSIQQLQLETEVISKAIEIFYHINTMRINDPRSGMIETPRRNKSVKGSRKIRLIFYCVFMAYKELNFPVDPSYVADIVQLPRNEVDQALSEYAPPGATLIEPEKMVRFYVQRINVLLQPQGISYNIDVVDRDVRRVIEICRTSLAGREWVLNTPAKIVAISALYFYMNDLKGLEIARDTNIFEQACYLSWACIRRYHEQIAKYYNLEDRSSVSRPNIILPFTM
jgi:hypothetical protein